MLCRAPTQLLPHTVSCCQLRAVRTPLPRPEPSHAVTFHLSSSPCAPPAHAGSPPPSTPRPPQHPTQTTPTERDTASTAHLRRHAAVLRMHVHQCRVGVERHLRVLGLEMDLGGFEVGGRQPTHVAPAQEMVGWRRSAHMSWPPNTWAGHAHNLCSIPLQRAWRRHSAPHKPSVPGTPELLVPGDAALAVGLAGLAAADVLSGRLGLGLELGAGVVRGLCLPHGLVGSCRSVEEGRLSWGCPTPLPSPRGPSLPSGLHTCHGQFQTTPNTQPMHVQWVWSTCDPASVRTLLLGEPADNLGTARLSL